MFPEWLRISWVEWDLRWFSAECNDNGGKCSEGNENPAAAAACKDCSRAAECSCALRRNSATELDRGSEEFPLLPPVGDKEDADEVGTLMGQHEHRPGNARIKEN